MVIHKCEHGEDFGRINTEIEDLKVIVKGNGKPGLQHTVIELNKTVQDLTAIVGELRTAISGFSRFQTQIESEVRAEEQQCSKKQIKRVNWQWGIGVASGIIIVIIERLI